GREVDVGRVLFVDRAEEGNGLAVGRPARAAVGTFVIGNFDGRSAGGGQDPDVTVVAEIELAAGAVGDESDAGGVGRPGRVELVPAIAVGDLAGGAGLFVDDDDVGAAAVEPAGVIELVVGVGVVADVAVFGGGRAGAGEAEEPRPVRGPFDARGAVFEVGD